MTENYRDICFCQIYKLKHDVEGIFDFFHAEKVPTRKKATFKYVDEFLHPSVSYEQNVGSVLGLLDVRLTFSPKQYLDRARELLTTTKMTKAIRLFVQQREKLGVDFLDENAKYPDSLFFILRVKDQFDSEFSSDIIPKIFKAKIMKSNLDFLLNKVIRRSLYGYVCPDYQYDASKFKFIGGIIPARLPVPKLISTKLGEASIKSIQLSFEDSPIGLENVTMSKENEDLVLALKIARKVNSFKDLYPRVLNEQREISELLLERVA